MTKSITLELPDWANWIAQDQYGQIWLYECKPVKRAPHFTFCVVVLKMPPMLKNSTGDR